jgi:hypothetical protein
MKERRFIDPDGSSREDPSSDGRPISEIFRDIISHVSEIVRSEIRLATIEAKQEIAELKTAAVSIVVGNVLIVAGGIFLLLGLVYGLSTIWPPWLAAVAVGAGVGIIGGVFLSVGIRKLKYSKSN